MATCTIAWQSLIPKANAQYIASSKSSDEITEVADLLGSHLYETDESWATEGADWTCFELLLPRSQKTIRMCPGICMDLK